MSVSVHDVVLVIIHRMHFLTFPGYCNLCNFDRTLVLLVNVHVSFVLPVLQVVTLVVELLVLLKFLSRVLRVSPQVLAGNLRVLQEVLQVVVCHDGKAMEDLVRNLDLR